MRVDDTECGRLAAQMPKNATEHGVFENVGKIAGMKFVAIIHGGFALSAAYGGHHNVTPAAGIPRHFRTTAKGQLLGHADTDLGQPSAIAGNVDRVTRKLRVRFQESARDLARRHTDRLIDSHIVRRDLHGIPGCAHESEVGFRRKTGAGAVPIPVVEDQPRTWHDVEHVINDRAREPRWRHPAVGWEAPFVLRPEAVDDKGEWPA